MLIKKEICLNVLLEYIYDRIPVVYVLKQKIKSVLILVYGTGGPEEEDN